MTPRDGSMTAADLECQARMMGAVLALHPATNPGVAYRSACLLPSFLPACWQGVRVPSIDPDMGLVFRCCPRRGSSGFLSMERANHAGC